MCGIAGVLHFNNQPADRAIVQRMTCAMAHRGPDADNVFVEGGIALGHRRLSIIDLSDAANQPFTDYSGRYVIVFNGEIYNYKDVKALLPDYPFRTNSDTETILAAYERWGIKCVDYLKGMFAFAIWDRQEKHVVIVRDRLGVKPLYYYYKGGVFLFASEQRALLASGLVPRQINYDSIYNYFSYQSVVGPQGMIAGVRQLEPGSYMIVQDRKVRIEKYWDITSFKGTVKSDKKEIQQHIYELLLRSVEQRLVSDVPVGAFLSGGIDSSAVVALMSQVSSAKPKTFVVGFKEKEYDESDYASIIAKKFNTDHHQILLQPQVMLEELTNALDAMDSPSGDGINTYVVSKEIKKAGITVALSGIGGDELFAGYPFFKQLELLKKYHQLWDNSSLLRNVGSTLVNNSKKKALLKTPDAGIENIYPVIRQVFSKSELRKLLKLHKYEDLLAATLTDGKKSIGQFPFLSQVSIAEYMGYTQHTLLKDADQMSMAVSLELREPFFDHELVEYVLAVPDAIKYPKYPKKLLIESLGDLLPDEIVHRKKQGFLFPWQVWMKNELQSFCEERIKNISQRPFVNGNNLLHYWQQFLQGDPSVRWAELWLFVVLEYWMEKNNVHE